MGRGRGPSGLWEVGPGDRVGTTWLCSGQFLHSQSCGGCGSSTLLSRLSQVLQRIQREAPTKEARGATQGRPQEEERELGVPTAVRTFLEGRGGGIAPGGDARW